jgi:hypothetical protein
MNTVKSLRIATIVAAAFLLGGAVLVAAQEKKVNFSTGQSDAFEVSDNRCDTIVNLSCIQLTSESTLTVGEVAAEFGVPFQRVLELNRWSSDVVSPDMAIPLNKKFALHGRGS